MSTATTPLQRPTGTSTRGRRSWWVAAAAVSVAVAATGVVLTVDDSSVDAPPSAQVPTSADPAPYDHVGITSADAAERRSGAAQATVTERCGGSSADAAQRCMSEG